MQPFTSHTGIAVPLLKDDVNTDEVLAMIILGKKPDEVSQKELAELGIAPTTA